MPKTTPCLWFDGQAEQAAQFYTSIFPNSSIVEVSRYGEVGPGADGSVMTVLFELDGQRYVGLNGGAVFQFNEAVSFQIDCADENEVDYYWTQLADGGEHGPCGWLKDRYGLSWQVVPTELPRLLSDPDPARAQRAMAAMMQMSKLDIVALRAAADAK